MPSVVYCVAFCVAYNFFMLWVRSLRLFSIAALRPIDPAVLPPSSFLDAHNDTPTNTSQSSTIQPTSYRSFGLAFSLKYTQSVRRDTPRRGGFTTTPPQRACHQHYTRRRSRPPPIHPYTPQSHSNPKSHGLVHHMMMVVVVVVVAVAPCAQPPAPDPTAATTTGPGTGG